MNLEIGQHGAYPVKEVRRIPVAAGTFNSRGGTSRVFNSEGGTSRVFNNAGVKAFNSEEGTSRVSNNAGRTARVFNKEEGASRAFNSDGRTTKTFTNEAGTNRVFNSDGEITRAITNEGGKMSKILKADANNNLQQEAHMQRNISEISSVFASGSDFETDYDGGKRNRSEAFRSSSTDGRLGGNNWIAAEDNGHVTKPNHPKGTLFGRWKMLNDEFQNKYLDYSANAERNQTQVRRISDFDRFENVRQVFSEGGGGMTRRIPLEENDTKISSYQLTSNKSYFVTEPAVNEVESLEKQEQTLVEDTSKVEHHKTNRAMIKLSKKEKKTLEMEHGSRSNRGKEILVLEKKNKKQKNREKQGKTIEKKAAEFVDGLLEDAWAVCIPRRRSVSMENLASTEAHEKRVTRGEMARLAQSVQSDESNENEDRTTNMKTSKQEMSSREQWSLENSSTADDTLRRQTRHFQDEGSSYTGKGATGMNARKKTGGYSTEENEMNVRTSVERFSSAAESADELDARTRVERAEGGQRSRSSNSSSIFDMHRGGIQQDVGHDLTHVIRPIPGSGSYTRTFSRSRHGSGSSTERRFRYHSDGYASDVTSLPSSSREKVRVENGRAMNHLTLESSRSLENLIHPKSFDDKTSTTLEIRQRCWSYNNLSADCSPEGGSDHSSPSVNRGMRRNRPPTLTKGMVTRVFHGCAEAFSSPGATPAQVHSQFQQIVYPQNDIRAEPGPSTDYTVFLPIKGTTDGRHLNSRATDGGTCSLEMIPYRSTYGQSQSASASPFKFHASSGATPDLESPGTTFSNLPIFVADVLSPMMEDYRPESQSEGFVRRQNTMASSISDDGGSCVASADVHMTRDQVLNFYVFNQPTTTNESRVQEITRSITLGDEKAPTLSRKTLTGGGEREDMVQSYIAMEREAPRREEERRVQPIGQTGATQYITRQREIQTLPVKRNVESTSSQTDVEGFYTADSEWAESRAVPVQMMTSREDRPNETSSFNKYFEEDTRYPVIVEERRSDLPVRVVVAKELTTVAPMLAAEKEKEEEEEFMETTIVEEKEEKICMEIREEVEFSMLRKQGPLIERDGGLLSVEPWWIPDRYEAVVDRRKIKTTKTEQLHNDEDYSLKRERHQLKDHGSVPTGSATPYYSQIPVVQQQRKGAYAAATGASGGWTAGTPPGRFISGRRGIGLPQRNEIHRNHYVSRQYDDQSPDGLGAFRKTPVPSSAAWKARGGKSSQNGGHSMESWSRTTGEQRVGSSYEPNNVSFGRKSDEMVMRELLDLGDSVSAKATVQDITRAKPSSGAYNGGHKVMFSSQLEPVAETKFIRDEDGNLAKVTEQKHASKEAVRYPSATVALKYPSAVDGGLRYSQQMRNLDSSYDEGSFGMNSETSDTNQQGSSSEESNGMKPVKHFETMATPL